MVPECVDCSKFLPAFARFAASLAATLGCRAPPVKLPGVPFTALTLRRVATQFLCTAKPIHLVPIRPYNQISSHSTRPNAERGPTERGNASTVRKPGTGEHAR